MAFWKRKSSSSGSPGRETPPAAAATPGGSGSPGAAAAPGQDDAKKARFLSGDALKDRRSVEVLLDAIARVSESRDLEALLDYVVDRSVEVAGAERGMLVLIDAAGEQQVRVARNSEGASLPLDTVKYSTSVVGKVVEEEEPIRTTVQTDAEALELGASVFDLKLRAVMCVPLSPQVEGEEVQEGREIGALYVDSKAATRAFNDEDLSMFFALAKHIAIALENARLNMQSLEKAKLEQSLEIASEIQEGLMPQEPPQIEGYEVFGWYRSAEHASGDFYDFVRTKDGSVALVVGDVTGHGIGPALITATAQASLRSYLRVLKEPAAIVTMLNEDIAQRMDDGKFLTLFLALVCPGGRVRVVNAGQTPPLVFRASDSRIDRIDGNGPAIGMMDDYEYEEGEELDLAPGDFLLAVTDGLEEARHHSHPERLFEETGVRAVLSDAGARGASARELAEELVSQVLEFSGGHREDDMTVVVLRRLADGEG